MSSKIVGSDSEFFAKMAVQATQSVKVNKDDGSTSYPISAINVLKAHGKSAKESQVIQGYAITTGRASQVTHSHEFLLTCNRVGTPADGLQFQHQQHTGTQTINKINAPQWTVLLSSEKRQRS